jgi:ribonuclease R
MVAIGQQCSRTERRADEATREVNAWLKCEYLREHVGQEFDGVVSSVTNFGLFVELKDLYIEGLVHISNLPGDYYHFDIPQQRLVGERSGRSFQLGSPLRVLVAAVNLDERKIDLEPVELPASAKQQRGGRGGQGARGAGSAKSAKGDTRGRGEKGKSQEKGAGGKSEAAAGEAEKKPKSSRRRRSKRSKQ